MLLKTRTVAHQLAVHWDTVRRAVRAGTMRAIRLTPRAQLLFDPEDLETLPRLRLRTEDERRRRQLAEQPRRSLAAADEFSVAVDRLDV